MAATQRQGTGRSSTFVDGAGFIQSDGSVPFAADQSMGGHQLTDLGDPVAPGDAAPASYVDAAVAAIISFPGLAIFGDGSDGDVTINADTRISAAATGAKAIKKYNNLTLAAGVTLGGDPNNTVITCIYVAGTLTMGNGSIITGSGGGTNRIAGAVASGSGGAGGSGGNGNAYLQVFARDAVFGTTTVIGSFGNPGGNGANGVGFSAGGGNNGNAPVGNVFATVTYGSVTNLTPGAAGVAAGTATAGGAAQTNEFRHMYLDPATNLFLNIFSNNMAAHVAGYLEDMFSADGSSGASGRCVIGAIVGLNGSSGAAGHGSPCLSTGTGGGGTAGGAASGIGSTGNIVTGGSGGAGGAGSFARVFIGRITSGAANLTVSCAGGRGGNGGTGAASAGGAWGGSSAGAGGPGGVAYYIGPAGPTVTAAGGASGTPGAGGNGGGTPAASGTGPNGITFSARWAA